MFKANAETNAETNARGGRVLSRKLQWVSRLLRGRGCGGSDACRPSLVGARQGVFWRRLVWCLVVPLLLVDSRIDVVVVVIVWIACLVGRGAWIVVSHKLRLVMSD